MFLLVLACPGSPGQKAVKQLCVCVCVINFLANAVSNKETGLVIYFVASGYSASGDIK